MPRIPTRTPPVSPSTPHRVGEPAALPTKEPVSNTAGSVPVGLDAATASGIVPTVGGNVPSAASGGLGGAAGAALAAFDARARPDGASLFALAPGRAPGAIPLPEVLRALGSQPQSRAAVERLVGLVQQGTGVELPAAAVEAAVAKPERLLDLLAFTPTQMSAGLNALQVAHQTGHVPDAVPRKYALPNVVDLAKLSSYPIELPKPSMKELAPGMLHGDQPGAIDDDDKKTRLAMAEVFDRLAGNTEKAPGERFEVQYNGGTFTRLDTFLKALASDGHEIEARVDHRVANFAALFTRGPDGQLVDVPAPVMVRTGVRDEQGKEAVVPSVHSELVITVRKTDQTKGPGVDADLKWYQGVPNTGFFAKGVTREPSWCGGVTTDRFTGKDALRAVELAGLFGDTVKSVAKAQNLYSTGYGVTGVCNDSVAVIQHALTGRTSSYPLLMQDSSLIGELEKRLSDDDRRDDPEYRTLRASIEALPFDGKANDTAKERALASVPWKAGEAPFPSTEDARRILSGE